MSSGIPVEPSPALKEDGLRLAHPGAVFRLLPHVLQRAEHVGCLARPAFGGSYLADVHIRKRGAKHGVDEVRDKRLSVVVAYDDRFEALEERKVVSRESTQLVCKALLLDIEMAGNIPATG